MSRHNGSVSVRRCRTAMSDCFTTSMSHASCCFWITLTCGRLCRPDAIGLVIFAHGSGSSRFSSRNRAVAEFLEARRCGTLLLDLLTREEEAIDVHTREYRFDIDRLGRRVVLATDWAQQRPDLKRLPI